MIDVSVAWTRPDYGGIAPPWNPGRPYPELLDWLVPTSIEGPPNPVYEAVRRALAALGFDADRFGQADWNPLGALVGVPYGALGKAPETRRVMQAVAGEIFDVLDRSGRHTHWRSAEAYLDVFYRELLPPTALHASSMLQDLAAGRATEIEALNGAVVRMGVSADVATPVNAALTDLVHAAEQRRRDAGSGD